MTGPEGTRKRDKREHRMTSAVSVFLWLMLNMRRVAHI